MTPVYLDEFVNSNEIADLIVEIDKFSTPSSLLGQQAQGFRTSATHYFLPPTELSSIIERRIDSTFSLPSINGEPLQGQKYEIGQFFKPHHDFMHRNQHYYDRQLVFGGQRTWTVMIYLNAPAQGGETYFPKLDITITPQSGKLIAWNNLKSCGNPNYDTLHEGKPVIEGTKYILTRWYRENPYPHQSVLEQLNI